jgi:hypothetical protein
MLQPTGIWACNPANEHVWLVKSSFITKEHEACKPTRAKVHQKSNLFRPYKSLNDCIIT